MAKTPGMSLPLLSLRSQAMRRIESNLVHFLWYIIKVACDLIRERLKVEGKKKERQAQTCAVTKIYDEIPVHQAYSFKTYDTNLNPRPF